MARGARGPDRAPEPQHASRIAQGKSDVSCGPVVIADRRGCRIAGQVRDDVPVMRLADWFAERSTRGMLTRAVGAWLLVGLPVIAARIWWSVAAAVTRLCGHRDDIRGARSVICTGTAETLRLAAVNWRRPRRRTPRGSARAARSPSGARFAPSTNSSATRLHPFAGRVVPSSTEAAIRTHSRHRPSRSPG